MNSEDSRTHRLFIVFKKERLLYYCSFILKALCCVKMNGQAFEPNDYVRMVYLYAECNYNYAAATRAYAERYPNRRHPSRNVFVRVIQRFEETTTASLPGQVGRIGVQRQGRAQRRNNATEERILDHFERNPGTSIRKAMRPLNLTYSSIQQTLKNEKLHAFHYQKVHGLLEEDRPTRVAFCQWLLGRLNENDDFINQIIFCDESLFGRDGPINLHNEHVYARQNPHAIMRTKHQRRFSVHKWAAIIGDRLIGPIDVPIRLCGQDYCLLLEEQVPRILETIPIQERDNLWFLHDGAPAHSYNGTQEFLNETFPNQWIGIGGAIRWPPRSPDLNPLDFFLWGTMKGKIYRNEITDLNDLERRIRRSRRRITPRMCGRAVGSMRRRLECCLECEGGYFEHLL